MGIVSDVARHKIFIINHSWYQNWIPFQIHFVRIRWFDRHFMQKVFILIQIKQQLLSQLVEPLQAKLIFNAFWLFPVHVRVKCFDDPKPKSPFNPNQSICIWLSVPKLAFIELVWDLAKFPCMTWKTFTLKLTRITIKHILNSFK